MRNWLLARLTLLVAVTSITLLAQSTGAEGARVSNPTHFANSQIKIGPGDLLQVNVFDEPEMAQTIRVSDAGSADFMLLGSLKVAGMTASDAQRFVEAQLLTRNFLRSPHVSITIQEYGTQGVSVLGEVKKPGVYPFLGSRNLLDILSQAGGTTPIASNIAMVKRRNGEQEKVTTPTNSSRRRSIWSPAIP